MYVFNFLIKLFSSWFFIGYIPFISATFGTLGAIPFVLILEKFFPLRQRIIFLVIFAVFSIFVSHLAEKIFGKKDDRKIVIDEVIGFSLIFLFFKPSFSALILSFFLFRFFDIVKIPPANQSQKLPGGGGVVVDDIVAGFQAAFTLWIFYAIF